MLHEAPVGPVALVFPGQGAHRAEMLDPFRSAPSFPRLHTQVCGLLGGDPLAAPERLNDNAHSSLLTVLASLCALELLPEGLEVVGVAGYSVGQWTALHAAGALSAEALLSLVFDRARLMDRCLDRPSGMLAVIGLSAEVVQAACDALRGADGVLLITNDNAPGQLTVGGDLAALERLEARLAELRPKRLVRLPVSGGWHSPLLREAVAPLAARIDAIGLGPMSVPVVDNTTGGWLPEAPAARRSALAEQVAQPVQWQQGVRTLIGVGARTLLEVGYGDTLSLFGFFIDRSVRHQALVRTPRPPRTPQG